MKLLIDLGNSRCKYAVLQEDGSMEYGAQNYGPFGKLYTVKSLCDKNDSAEKVIICSVLSEKMNTEIKETIVDKDGRDVFYLNPAKNSHGIQLAYNDASTIGVDRVAAMIAAKEKYSGNSCVVDCGTAVTIDAIDSNGTHRGGVILPGSGVMQKALLSNTKIEAGKIEENFNVFADSTEVAIHSGCVSAMAGGIDFVINKMGSNGGAFDQVVMTGGDAEKMKQVLSDSKFSSQVTIDEYLVLDGLRLIAESM